MTWLALAIAAACLQLLRNAQSRELVGRVSPELTAWARFALGLPFSALLVGILVAREGAPATPPAFYAWCLGTALTQLAGNVALVAAFRRASFARSIALYKLDVVLGAAIGVALFGEFPSALGWTGIVVSSVGVLLLNTAREDAAGGLRTLRGVLHDAIRLDTGAWLALASAALLGFTSFLLKEGALVFELANPGDGRFAAAAHTLFHTTWMQVLVLSLAIRLRRPGELARVPALWRPMLGIGATSFAGSLCWYWAYTLALVAYVRAVGQVELVLSVAVSLWLFGERAVLRQIPGVAVVTAGIALVLLG